MSTTNLYLDLGLTTSWITEDNSHGVIQGSYEQKQQNIPQVVWSLNVLPFSGGAKSLTLASPVTLAEQLLPAVNNLSNLWEIKGLLDQKGNLTYLILDDNVIAGTFRKFHYWYNGQWRLLVQDVVGVFHFFHRKTTVFQNTTMFVLTSGDVFGAGITVTGDSPLNDSVFLFNVVTATVSVYNLTGISLRNTQRKNGITSYQNYLLFWDSSRLYWSSPTNFQDFTPAIGGGGSTQISEARGDIITIVPNSTGLMIYCKGNVVHAAFSGDSANPWIFREVPNSTGVLIESGNPIVSTNESSEFQVYMGSSGLTAITENGAKSLDVKMLEFLNNSVVELKAVGSVDITKKVYNPASTRAPSKLRNLEMFGNLLFIFVGEVAASLEEIKDNRLYIYNLQTGQIAKLDGDYHGCYHHLNLNKDIDNDSALYNKVDAFPDEYILGRRYDNTSALAGVVVNFAGGIEREAGYFPPFLTNRTPEMLIGPVSVSRSSTTTIQRIKPDGDIQLAGNDASRLRVLVYSKSTMGATDPVEFIYNPVDGNYYGYAEGKDLMIELRGNHFYLVGLEVEVEQGGYY